MRSYAAGIVAICLAAATTVHADVYTVNDAGDAVDANLGDGLCSTAGGACSLRAAVQQANAHAGADEIVLPFGHYKLTLVGAGEDAAATGDLDVSDDLTITGPGIPADFATIDGNATDRVFDVQPAVNLTLVLVGVENGAAAVDPRGGGILNAGTLTLDRVALIGNKADDGAGNGAGGALYNLGTATVRGSFVGFNVVSTTATATGAGIHNAGTLDVVNSTVGDNNGLSSQASGAGIYNASSGTTELSNATIAFNGDPNTGAQRGPGGGVFNAGGSVTVQNTVLAANQSNPPGDCSGTLTSDGYDVIQDASGCTLAGDLTGVQTGVSAGLVHTFVTDGGATILYRIDATSSALVDAGNPAPPGSGGGACEARDQRGYNRAVSDRCDVGAEEVSFCPPFPTIFDSCFQHPQLAGKGKLEFKNQADDAKDGLKWAFTWGPITPDSLFGTGTDDYVLCIWDGTGAVGEALIPGGGTCSGKPCWTDSLKGLKYADKQATPDGVTAVHFTAGKGAKIGLKGKGIALRLTSPPWSGTVTVRLRDVDAADPQTACWQTTHNTPKVNTPARYAGRGD